MTVIQYIRRGYIGEKKEFNKACYKITIEQVARSPKVGVMVATGQGKIGYVLLARDERRRDWKWAKELATKRANDPENYPNPPAPNWFKQQLEMFTERSSRYFK